MLNRYLAILLLVALVSSNCSRFFVYAGFEANQGYIAKVMCENKSRPWLHCNGRCYLMKKLKQAEEREKKQERQDQKSRYQEALPQAPYQLTFITPGIKVSYAQAITPGIMHRSFSIFQPPQVRV